MTAQFTFCVQMPSGRIVAIDGHAEFDREERQWIATAGETGAKGISDDCVIACAEAVRNANGPCFLPARKEGA